jgi:hypothetical protein
VAFTESQLVVKNGSARVFGDPVTVSGGTRPDGSVVLNTQGTLSVVGLRQAVDLPLLDHLSGSTPWKGAVTVPKKGGVEFVLDSNLNGIVSSLPDPLNKSAAASLPFRFEMAVPAGAAGVTPSGWRPARCSRPSSSASTGAGAASSPAAGCPSTSPCASATRGDAVGQRRPPRRRRLAQGPGRQVRCAGRRGR